MNTLTLQKQARKQVAKLERSIKSASRALLEIEIAQSELDYAQGRFKIYKSSADFMKHVMNKVNS